MRKTWTLGATGAALAAVFAAGGCYDFDGAQQRCVSEGRCEEEGGGPGTDAGCTPVPDVVDLPDDAFADTDCDGVDGQADAGLFVDPATGDDEARAGTRERPLRTLGRALEILREADAGPTRLYLAGGAYDEAGLVLDVPASLHGGYTGSSGGWQRAQPNLAHLDGGTVGLTVRNLPDSGLVVEYVHVHSTDAVEPGGPSIALRVVGSSDVVLRHVILEAGRGGDGTQGGEGAPGTFGADGGIGGDGGVGNSETGAPGTAGQ
ncbi:hypothetical protein ACLESO_57740, partial [Pyxidicoccus sp. 3LG]